MKSFTIKKNVTKKQISYCKIPERGELINALQFCQGILYFLRTSTVQKLKYPKEPTTQFYSGETNVEES